MIKLFKDTTFTEAKKILPYSTIKELLLGKGQGLGWYFFLLGIYIIIMNPLRVFDSDSEINKFWYAKLILLITLSIIVLVTIAKLILSRYHILREVSNFMSTYVLTLCIVVSIATGVMSVMPFGLITGVLVFIVGIFINYVFFIIGLKKGEVNLKESNLYRKIESGIWYIFVVLLLVANAFRLLKIFPSTSQFVSDSLSSSDFITSVVISFLAIVIPAMYLEFNAMKIFNGILLIKYRNEFKNYYEIPKSEWKKGMKK